MISLLLIEGDLNWADRIKEKLEEHGEYSVKHIPIVSSFNKNYINDEALSGYRLALISDQFEGTQLTGVALVEEIASTIICVAISSHGFSVDRMVDFGAKGSFVEEPDCDLDELYELVGNLLEGT